jgi:hypothetical protein
MERSGPLFNGSVDFWVALAIPTPRLQRESAFHIPTYIAALHALVLTARAERDAAQARGGRGQPDGRRRSPRAPGTEPALTIYASNPGGPIPLARSPFVLTRFTAPLFNRPRSARYLLHSLEGLFYNFPMRGHRLGSV